MSSTFHVRFHGVRGSLATPGPATAAVGGNTSCVEVTCGDTRIVLDAGTGLRAIGDALAATGGSETTLLLSHLHWDHIQGLPFFTPIYLPGHTVEVISGPNGVLPLEAALRRQMAAPFFPVDFEEVSPQLRAREARAGEALAIGPATVRLARLNHPDPVWGYRIEHAGRAVVYATDTEHYACVDPVLTRLARGADVLIYDAQYTPDEYPGKVGWGHSTWAAAVELARAAAVKTLVLFHHDPGRSDGAVAELEARARELFPSAIAAREGAVIDLAAAGAPMAEAA